MVEKSSSWVSRLGGKNKYLLAIFAGHVFTDINPGALPVMLPFLIAAGGLNYTQAAGLTFAVSLASSLSQPVFGIVADKIKKTWFLPLGVLLAGLGISIIGFSSSYYWLMFCAALICGIGVAAFHPEGARLANGLSGKKKGGSMGFFTIGGTIGMAIGPLMATPAMLILGLRGSAAIAIPSVIVSIIIFSQYSRMIDIAEVNKKEEAKKSGVRSNEWPKFLWLSIAIVSRSIIGHSLNTFLVLYWVNVLLQSKATGGMIITYMTCVGTVATLIGANLADRYGMRRIIKIGWIILIPSVFLLPFMTNPLSLILILFPITVGNYVVNTPMIVLGQQYLPKNVGFASGITLGLGVSIGGLFSPLLGSYADIHGLTDTFKLLCILPVLGFIVAMTSKQPRDYL